MNRDLLDNSEILPPSGETEKKPDKIEGKLPAGLTIDELKNLSSAEIDRKIKEQGAGIGYAGMIALALGAGPAGTRYHACAFLMNRAAELADRDAADRDIGARLRSLPREELLQLIEHYEEKASKSAIHSLTVIDVATGH